jgi:hypothetical protein
MHTRKAFSRCEKPHSAPALPDLDHLHYACQCLNLKAVMSLGAGVDHILQPGQVRSRGGGF